MTATAGCAGRVPAKSSLASRHQQLQRDERFEHKPHLKRDVNNPTLSLAALSHAQIRHIYKITIVLKHLFSFAHSTVSSVMVLRVLFDLGGGFLRGLDRLEPVRLVGLAFEAGVRLIGRVVLFESVFVFWLEPLALVLLALLPAALLGPKLVAVLPRRELRCRHSVTLHDCVTTMKI